MPCAVELNFASVLKDLKKTLKDELKAKNESENSVGKGRKRKNSSKTADIPTTTTKSTGMKIHLSTFAEDPVLLETFAWKLHSITASLGLASNASGPSAPPTCYDRWTVLSSPFVHKVARTQFERRLQKRTVHVGQGPEMAKELLMWYVRRIAPTDIQLAFTIHESINLDSI